MKNIFIQKIITNKNTNNKPFEYLVTTNKDNKDLESAKVLDKENLLKYLNNKLS